MRLLAIDTATERCSVALLSDGRIVERSELAPRRHADRVLAMAQEVLAEEGVSVGMVDALAFGRGPGSFTGLRIAAGVVQGIAYGAELPVIGVSNLAAVALGAMRATGASAVAVAMDARMGEVYWGLYRRSGDSVLLLGEEAVLAPAGVGPLPEGEWLAAGTGWEVYGDGLAAAGEVRREPNTPNLPEAADVARLAAVEFEAGRTLPPEQAIPVYLRDNVAAKAAR